MDFDKFNKIVEDRIHYGELDDSSVVSEYKNIGCGDNYRLYLQIEEDRILGAKFTTTGCSFSIASLDIVCDLLKDKTLAEARSLTADQLEEYIDGYPERRRLYADTALAAVNQALDDYENGTGLQAGDIITRKEILEKLKIQGHLRNEKLASAMLDSLDLKGVDFAGANLQNAYLRHSDLSQANLAQCNLKGAYIDHANLTNANLSGADLRFAKLTGATFEGTVVDGAIYDIGTRVLPKDVHLFDKMIKKGKEFYLKNS